MFRGRRISPWLLAALLTLPVWFCFLAYFLKAGEQHVAIGFFQDDNPLYVSYARQYLDQDRFHLFYSNPYNESGDYPRIYFQVQNFWFALLLKAGIPPGWVMLGFTLMCSLFFFRIMLALVDHLYPRIRNRLLISLLMAWGGGLLFISSIAVSASRGIPGYDRYDNWFLLDPAWGWWGLNLGRSLLFSAEAYYHCLFFGGMLLLFQQKWKAAAVVGLLLTASHPFTGLEFLLIANTWLLGEKVFFRNKNVPVWAIIAMGCNMLLHLCYYLLFLPAFADHASVLAQYSINWSLRYFHIIPAYCIVGFLAYFSICRLSQYRGWFADPQHRLLASWILGVALLSNHEIFMPPMQPLHFTRGYMYSALFLAGVPALDYWINRLRSIRYGKLLLAVVCLVFLSDNIAWMINYSRPLSKPGYKFYLDKGENEVLQWMKEHVTNQSLVLSENENLSYMVPAFTPGYSWVSHYFTTPFFERKKKQLQAFIAEGKMDSSWQQKDLLYIAEKKYSDQLNRLEAIRPIADSIMEFKDFRIARFRIDTTGNTWQEERSY